MKSVTISQDLCHIVAKAGRNNEQKWLPLWMHARDTAEVMKYLIREWLPESVAKLLEKAIIQQKKVSRNDVEKLGVFLGYIHDFGKANSYFQCLITKNIPERLVQIKEDGTSVLAWESYEKKGCNHAYVSEAFLSCHGRMRKKYWMEMKSHRSRFV